MKRRIISFLLCLAMILTSFIATSCGKTTDETKETESGEEGVSLARSSMTLTLWLPVEPGTTEESLELVEEAINEITQTKFDTAIKLYGVPTDEYEAVMEKQMADIQERIDKAYRDQEWWAKAAILNIAKSGKFTSDRTIQQYVDEIWHLEKITVNK